MKYTTILFLILLPSLVFCQITERATTGPFLLKDVQIISAGKDTIISDILIKEGLITQISSSITSEEATEIDCSGLSAYPGLFDSGTAIGLHEISSIGLTEDFNEIGSINPQLNALTAINPHSTHIPITRVEGITNALVLPEGGVISGQAHLISLYGNTPQQMSNSFEAMVINFPSLSKRHYWDRRDKDKIEKDFNKNLKKLNEVFDEAMLYAQVDSSNRAQNNSSKYSELRLEALSRYLKNDLPFIINVDKAHDVLAALEWQKKHKLNTIITGCRDCSRIADSIATYNVPVIVGPILSLPQRSYDRYDTPYTLASTLHDAGILIAIKTDEKRNNRNLPYHAGYAAAYGLGKENALAAVTINPAKIFGIDDVYGSIEVGKSASLFITDGDPFETKTSIKHVFIDGYNIPLVSRQTELYDQFLDREQGADPFYGKD